MRTSIVTLADFSKLAGPSLVYLSFTPELGRIAEGRTEGTADQKMHFSKFLHFSQASLENFQKFQKIVFYFYPNS